MAKKVVFEVWLDNDTEINDVNVGRALGEAIITNTLYYEAQNDEDTIPIKKKRFDALVKSEAFLEALEANGVDNWSGYSDAWRSVNLEEE
jgi:hypothetical protein